jgi:hypothetical protein
MTTTWQADDLTIDQGLQDFGVNEDRTIAVDVTKDLVAGETVPTSPASQLWLLGEDGAVDTLFPGPLNGAPGVSGTMLQQRVTGTTMTVGRIYKLVLSHGPANNRRSANVPLRVVE